MKHMTTAARRVCAAMFAACATAFAPCGAKAESEVIGDLVWFYEVDGGAATITGVERTTEGDRVEGVVNVPDELGQLPVTAIGFRAFYYHEFITEVVMPNGITTIGDSAFAGCKRLTTLAMPSTVGVIDVYAFEDCSTLSDLTLNEGLTEIRDEAFKGCAALASLKLPSTVQTLGDGLFSELPLTAMELPDSVIEVGSHIFDGCGKLESVVVGRRVPELTFRMFRNCEVLTSVTLKEGYLDLVGESAFAGCKRLVTLSLPSTVRTIGAYAFKDCSTLANLTLNEGLTEIGDYAFSGCAALTSLTLPSTVETLGDGLFSELPLVTMEIPDSVTTIGSHIFDGCDKLESVVVGKRVGDLTFRMFRNCVSLTSVTLKEGYLDLVGESAFAGCERLATLTLPSTVRTIGAYAFKGCTSLRSVMVNDGLTEVYDRAFSNCSALHYVYFQGDMPYVGDYIFDGVNDRMVVYVSESSSGFGETIEGHPVRPISAKPANADNPYDFYPVVLVDWVRYDQVAWSAPVILTTNRYVYGETVPATPAAIREGDPVYLSFAFNEYWRGEAFDVTSRFTLGGAKSATFDLGVVGDAHSDNECFGRENATPAQLQGLAPGKYTLKVQLNAGNVLEETDYSNNATSITFTVVAGSHTVKFNANGGSVGESSRKVKDGGTIGKLPPATRSGHVLSGWYTAKSGGKKVTASTVVTGDMTVYARWTAAWTVTLNANGGKVDGAKTGKVPVQKGKAVGALPKAIRKGYKFNGWYTKKSGGTKIKTTTKVTKNVTYYARWTAIKYTIKFNANGGKGTMKALSATYDKTVALRANTFKRAKYAFAGWAKSKNGAVVYKNKAKVKNLASESGKTVTLYAKWKKAKSSSVESARAGEEAGE